MGALARVRRPHDLLIPRTPGKLAGATPPLSTPCTARRPAGARFQLGIRIRELVPECHAPKERDQEGY